MIQYDVLAGLPPYGPLALPFAATGNQAFREGLVVRFRSRTGDAWVGNFQPGLTGFNSVLPHPDERLAIVIAGGAGYIVDPELRQHARAFGGNIGFAQALPDLQTILTCDGIGFEAFCANDAGWISERISSDEIGEIVIVGFTLRGAAWSPPATWRPFEMDLRTGKVRNGIYEQQSIAPHRVLPLRPGADASRQGRK